MFSIVFQRIDATSIKYLENTFWVFTKGNTMSNQQQGSNEAPKTPAPSETKPAPQQNQGDDKPGSEKPAQQK
jgi:hypothetical protein